MSNKKNKFIISEPNFNPNNGTLYLQYRFEGSYQFIEKITFPKGYDCSDTELLKILFQLLNLACGVSYYKLFCPTEVFTEYNIPQNWANFFKTFYIKGLGELSYNNKLKLNNNISFNFDKSLKIKPFNKSLSESALIAVGGGKDSCVSMSLTTGNWTPFAITMTSLAQPIKKCIQISGKEPLIIHREISPELIKLNKEGIGYNGHLPISGIFAFISLVMAVLYDKKYVILSNEASANSGNLFYDDMEINHQWSKSFEFEKMFFELTGSIIPNFRYFSLLRPISEIQIASIFAQKCQKYFDVFTSCNHAFFINESKRTSWCQKCDKCRFVFLMLAPFMKKEDLIKIVGKNLLNNPENEQGYAELLALSGHKPFNCVGEDWEVQMAFNLLSQNPDWANDLLVKKFKNEKQYTFPFNPNHLIPKEYEYVIKEFKK